jgi:gliding motility-associated-like protein
MKIKSKFNFYAIVFLLIFSKNSYSQTFTSTTQYPLDPPQILTSPISVSGLSTCESPDTVIINLTRMHLKAVCIWLKSPLGKFLELSTENGNIGSVYESYTNTIFTDHSVNLIPLGSSPFSGSFKPEGRGLTLPIGLGAIGTHTFESTFRGDNPNGTWELYIDCKAKCDDINHLGTLFGWSIKFNQKKIYQAEKFFCIGPSISLNTQTVGTQYTWSTGATTPTISVNPTTNTDYVVTVVENNGCLVIEKNKLLLSPPFNINVPDKNICIGQSTTLNTQTIGTQYTWSTGATTPTISINPTINSNYTVTIVDNNGCIFIEKIKVNVDSAPNVAVLQDVALCKGAQITLLNPLGYKYLWSTGQTNPNINVSPVTNATYVVSISNTTGSCPAVKTFNVNVVLPPQINLGPDFAVCGQNTTVLIASGGGSYAWSNGQTTNQISVNPSVTTTYAVTVTNATGCTAIDDVKITVNPISLANAGLDKNLCIGKSTTLTATGGGTYAWSNGTTSATNTVNPTSNTSYSVTVTTAAGCSSVDDVLVNVNPLPTATASPDISICQGKNTNLTASGGQSYIWSNGSSGSNINVNPSVTTTYMVTVSDANSCTTTAQTTVNINTMNVNSGTDVTICSGQNANLTATSSNSATYLWNNGTTSSSNSVSPISTTTYTVTATDNATGCTKTDDIVVNVIPPPTANAGADLTVCIGSPANLLATGGQTYQWSNGSSSALNTFFPNNSSTYTVTVSNGTCSSIDQVNVNVIQSANVSILAPSSLCSGMANLSASAGFSAYNWSNGQTGQNISVTQPGLYTVTTTDGNGCKANNQVTIAPPPFLSLSAPYFICPGKNVDLMVNQNFTTYNWSNGQSGKTINVSQSGIYTVTVSDANGCTQEKNIAIDAASKPNLFFNGANGICPNSNISLNVTSNANSFLWSNGATQSNINITQAGTYSVTVTNSQGCTNDYSTTIVNYQNPMVQIQGINKICESGGNVTLYLNNSFAEYLWSNGTVNPTFSAQKSGNYSLTVTDANGCKATDQFFIAPQKVVPTITGSTSFCPGQSTLLNATAPNATTYLWSNGAISAAATINTTGKIYVTVTDNLGCKGVTSTDVTSSSSLSPSIVGKNKICEGAETTFDVGNGFSSILWSDGTTKNSIKVTKSGTYTVSVSDGFCNGTASVTLDVVKNDLKIAFIGDTLICPNTTTSLEIDKNFATYNWNNNGGNFKIENIPAGKYSVSVTDNVGCKSEKTIEIKTSAAPTPKILGNATYCPGGFTILKSEKYKTYLWNTTSKDSFITVKKVGQYDLTVSDSEGCVGTTFVNVIQTNGLLPPINGKTTLCKGEKLTIGTDDYATYLWSDGTNNKDILIEKAGIYKVSVSDVSGCKGENTITILEKIIPKPEIIGDTLFCEGMNKSLTINGLYKYDTYQWSDGTKQQTLNNLKSGTYILTVSEGACIEKDTFNVKIVKNNLTAKINGDSVICQGEKTILSNLDKNIVTYTWKNGVQTITNQDSLTSKGNTTWALTVTDKYGCTASSSLKIVEIPLPKTKIKGDSLIINSVLTSLDAGAGFSSYLWTTGEKTQIISISKSGIYEVTVTNQNGCQSVAKIVVKALNFIKPEILGKEKICQKEKTTLMVNSVFDTYLWSNGTTNQSTTVDKSGIYFVTVTKSGLAGIDTFEVVQSLLNPSLLAKDYNGFGVSCEGKSNGTIKVENLNGAIKPLSFTWSNGSTKDEIKDLKSGTYEVKIKDGFGCEWTQKTTLSAPPTIDFTLQSVAPNCKKSNSGSILVKGITNVIFPYKIENNGLIFSNIFQKNYEIKDITAGQYDLKITDANGCESSQKIEIEKQIIPKVNLGEDLVIYAGDSVQLTAISNITADKILWSKISELSCLNCMNPIVKPSESGDYEIIIVDKYGCEATDKMNIKINRDIYVPSIFSPNGDTNNDVFTIYGNKSIKKINRFLIQDRWGNEVFNGDTNNPSWDGTFRNQPCQNGVYIYLIEVEFKDGKTQKLKGDVTLYR